jgi:hypothetical protein
MTPRMTAIRQEMERVISNRGARRAQAVGGHNAAIALPGSFLEISYDCSIREKALEGEYSLR